MKKLFLSFIAAGMLLAACNQGSSSTTGDGELDSAALFNLDSADAPIISFAVQTYDFGKVKSGEKVNYEYEFTNTGKSPLLITNATASCGCTVPDWPKKPVKPGESAKIKVTFDSEGKTGMQDKLVTVTANTVPAQTQVHLTGDVLPKE